MQQQPISRVAANTIKHGCNGFPVLIVIDITATVFGYRLYGFRWAPCEGSDQDIGKTIHGKEHTRISTASCCVSNNRLWLVLDNCIVHDVNI
jgi:hypothetical protein